MTRDVKGIDIIIKRQPTGQSSIHLVDTGQGLRVTHVTGAAATEYQNLREIGQLVGDLLGGTLQSAMIHIGANGQMQTSVTHETVSPKDRASGLPTG